MTSGNGEDRALALHRQLRVPVIALEGDPESSWFRKPKIRSHEKDAPADGLPRLDSQPFRMYHGAAVTEGHIRFYWGLWPNAVPAARMGPNVDGSRYFVALDVDEHRADHQKGSESLAGLEAEHGPLPETFREKTPTGNGEHILLTDPTHSLRTKTEFLPQLDLKSGPGYIVVYGDVPPDIHVAEAPDWLTNQNVQRMYEGTKIRSGAGTTQRDPQGRARFQISYRALGKTLSGTKPEWGKGERHDLMTQMLGALAPCVPLGSIPGVARFIDSRACSLPMQTDDASDFEAIVRDAQTWHLKDHPADCWSCFGEPEPRRGRPE